MRQTAEQVMDQMVEYQRKRYAGDSSDQLPFYHLYADGGDTIAACDISGDTFEEAQEAKAKIAFAVRKMAKEAGTHTMAFVMEGWALEFEGSPAEQEAAIRRARGTDFSLNPNRVEVLSIIVTNDRGEKIQRGFTMKRNADNTAVELVDRPRMEFIHSDFDVFRDVRKTTKH